MLSGGCALSIRDHDLVSDIVSKNELMQLKRKMRNRVITSLCVIFIIFSILAHFNSTEIKGNALNNAVDKIDIKLETVSSLEKTYINFLKNIVFQLSSNIELQSYLITRDELSKQLILDYWTKVSEQTNWMFQIRLITNSGHELVKIEYDQEKQLADNIASLQNKSDKEYVKQGKKLKREELYISPIELNREYSELSYPIMPVFRIASNIITPTGQSLGLLVVNVIANKFLSVNADILASEPGNTVVLDHSGNYLQGGGDQNWGHILTPDLSINFSKQYPKVWAELQQSMSPHSKGIIIANAEQFVYRLLNLSSDAKKNTPYIVIHQIKYSDLQKVLYPQLVKNFLTYLLVFIILSFALWFYYKRQLYQESEHHSLELISALFYSNEAIFITDENWKISVINQAFCHVTGYSRDEIIGMTVAELYFLEEQTVYNNIVHAVKEHEYWLGEIKTLSKNGTWLTNVMSINTVKNGSGKVSNYVVHMIDISDRKEMEEKLKVAAVAFETRSAITIANSEGNIIRVNKAFTEITGYQENEVLEKNPNILSSGKHSPSFYQELWQSIISHGSWQGEIYNRHKDGKIFPEWINISSIKDEGGDVKYYVATFEDITERKRLETELANLSNNDL